MSDEHHETGTFYDLRLNRLFRPGTIWYVPAVSAAIFALVQAGIPIWTISIAE